MDVERVIADYLNGDSMSVVAERYGCCAQTVSNHLRRKGLLARSPGHHMKGNHNLWRGGKRKHSEGYVEIHVCLVEDEFKSMAGKSAYIREHRLVMARALGRPLETYEQVHHKDGVRDNNALENLQLRVGNHGTGFVLCCGDCGSTNIVAGEI